MLGDGTVLQTSTLNIVVGTEITGKVAYKAMIVDVTYLCNSICDYALWYYENHQEKFESNYAVITQEEFLNPSKETSESDQGNIFVQLLNEKLKKDGSTKRFEENSEYKPLDRMSEDLRHIFSDNAMKQRFLNGESVFTFSHFDQSVSLVEKSYSDIKKNPKQETETTKKSTNTKNKQKKKQSSKSVSKEKHEAQVRSFFGKHFKKKIYLDKKEEIIQAVLKSKTKLQVNNNLMKYFTNKEVKVIYQRLEPLIKDLPGR